jgi:hypothetical protein
MKQAMSVILEFLAHFDDNVNKASNPRLLIGLQELDQFHHLRL